MATHLKIVAMTIRSLACAALFFVFANDAYSEQIFTSGAKPPQLIELFTSEGCSSCPPADRLLSSLDDHEGLWTEFVPLAFHVDYWDWLGWKDRFASPENTNRQRKHHQNGKVDSVYTPGFVVAGNEWRGFFGGQPIPNNNQELAKQLQLSVSDNRFDLTYNGESTDVGIAYVAILGMDLETQVKRGENSGRKLTHDFVVLDWQALPAGQNNWNGTIKTDWDEQTSRYAIAAWVERSDTPVPLQVVAGYLDKQETQ